jgi:diguanylate cyclase (GGDEF)-like protein/PAS domain S-box-containing protein
MTASSQDQHIQTLKNISKIASVVTMLIGGATLLGWWLNLPVLKSILPQLASMKANSALGFLLGGLALWLLQTKSNQPRLLLLRRACAVLVTLIGLLTLSEYLFHGNLGIDQLLVTDNSIGEPFPGRMVPVTALNFSMLGVALLIIDSGRRYYLAQLLTLVAGLFALFGLLGYLYGVESFYQIASYASLPFQTALTFPILCLGILYVAPDHGWMALLIYEGPGRVLTRRLLPSAILVPIVLGWLVLLGQTVGLYDAAFGLALFTILNIVVFASLIITSAVSLYKIDNARQHAEDNLRLLNSELDGRVLERTEQLTQVNQQLHSEVTERKQAETALRESQERFAILFRNSPAAIALARLEDGRYLDVNEGFLRLVGFERAEILGHTAVELGLLSPTDRAKNIQGLQEHGLLHDFEVSLKTKSGDLRLCLISAEQVDVGHELCSLSILYDITERKRVEQESERLKTALDRMAEGAQIISFDWRYVYLNDSAALQGARPRHELIGHTMMEMYPGIDQTPLFTIMQRCMAERTSEHFENQFTFPDGSLGWFDLSIQPIPEGIFILSTDISQRKQADAALRESEAKLRALFEVLPVGISILDDQRRIVETNPAFERILKLSPDDLANGDIPNRQFIHPDGSLFQPTDFPSRQALDAQRAILDVEVGVVLENKQTIWTSVSAVPVSASNLGVIVVTTDITERKQTDAALAEERDLLQALLDNIPDTIYFKDTASRFTRINQAQARVLGVSEASQAIGKTDADFTFSPDLAASFFAEEQQLLQTRRPLIDRQEFNPTPTGQPRWFSATKVPMIDRQGRVSGLIGISRDITHRINAEEDLQKANGQLTDRVAQMALLNELEEQLQACLAVTEVYQVTAQLVAKLFPAEAGALYVINNSRNWVETGSAWGAMPPEAPAFGLEDCWALRRGRTHLSGIGQANLPCRHLDPAPPPFSVCMPLLAQGETLGVLHLRAASAANPWDEAKEQLARVIADSIALALANLKLRETLRQQSIRDPLTELFNRRYMEESLERELLRSARTQRPVGIIMIDVDNFKKMNDAYGHDFGDAVLRQLGRFLKERTRGGDIACRYGGEEFTLILPEANLEQTRLRAEQHLQDFQAMPVHHNGQLITSPTLSLGVAAYPQHGAIAADVLKAADSALYRAKHEGRNRVIVSGA